MFGQFCEGIEDRPDSNYRKKHLYAALEIPEYWVIDVRGRQVLAFLLQTDGSYGDCDTSKAFSGLAIA